MEVTDNRGPIVLCNHSDEFWEVSQETELNVLWRFQVSVTADGGDRIMFELPSQPEEVKLYHASGRRSIMPPGLAPNRTHAKPG